MRNNETGEFELVVGNRQLLSGFFIVVLLFAVAFAMGYIFGQNSPRSARLQPEPASAAFAAGDARPQAASPASPAVPASQPPSPETAQAADGATPNAPVPEPQPTTQPARESPAAAPAPPPPPPAAPVEAAPGTYWQVMAVNHAEAVVVAKALKDKGFPASTAPGPNNLMRVLVGPYNDTQSMGRAKTQLENAGFHPIRK